MNKVRFVDGDERRAAFDGGKEAALFFVDRLRGIENNEHQRSIGEGLAAASDADLLGFFARLVQAGGDGIQRPFKVVSVTTA